MTNTWQDRTDKAFAVTLLITQTIICKGVGSTNISVFSILISSGAPVKYKDHAALPLLPLAASSWMPHSLTFYFDILVYSSLALMWNTLPLWLCNRLGRGGGTPQSQMEIKASKLLFMKWKPSKTNPEDRRECFVSGFGMGLPMACCVGYISVPAFITLSCTVVHSVLCEREMTQKE